MNILSYFILFMVPALILFLGYAINYVYFWDTEKDPHHKYIRIIFFIVPYSTVILRAIRKIKQVYNNNYN